MLAYRCTFCATRSPYGMGWRMATTFFPCARSRLQTLREVWLLPAPVRTATTAITGFVERIMVFSAPSTVKLAPSDMTSEALDIT